MGASSFEVCSSPRNVSDQILSQLAANGGVIMICFAPSMIDHPRGQNGTVEQVADHIVYVGERIGFDHVGIESDFDGMLQGPQGLEDVSCYPNLLAELLRRVLSEENIKLVIGLNIIRVMGEVERVSALAQQNRTSVLCDSVEEVWTREQRDVLIAQGIKIKKGTSNI